MWQALRVPLCGISSRPSRRTARRGWTPGRGWPALFCVLFFLSIEAPKQLPIVWAAPQGQLETPAPGTFQSGVGLIRGWVCSASRVDIEVVGRGFLAAVYGEGREDTRVTCGDSNNGFSLQFNWNDLGEGVHTVRALADGEEVGRATVTVATLGQAFFLGAQGEFPVEQFPSTEKTSLLRWLESRQQFVLSTGGTPATGGSSPRADAKLEDPQSGTFQSGIGVIRGWVCNASRVDVEIVGRGTSIAVYGQPRGDTRAACGDDNNGFSAQVNWNDLGDGDYTVLALADGVEFGQATFTVVTLGLGSFPLGLIGVFTLPNFPQQNMSTAVAWQESQQNFVVTGARYEGISEGLCVTQQGEIQDREGGRAMIRWSNPCLLSGNLAVQNYQVPAQRTSVSTQESPAVLSGELEQRAVNGGGFFLCERSLTIRQGDRVFTGDDFRLIDLTGTEVCRELPPGTSLDVFLQVEATSDLNFNAPFVAAYENQEIFTFVSGGLQTGTPILTLSAEQVDFGPTPIEVLSPMELPSINSDTSEVREQRTQSGVAQEKTFTVTNSGNEVLRGGMTLIATGSGGNVFTIVSADTLSIEPGQSQTVTLRYIAVENSPTTGSLRISTNGGVKSLLLRGGGQTPTPQPKLTVQAVGLDFGQVQIGQTADRTFTVTNTGDGTLTGSISTSPPFSIVGNDNFSRETNQSQTVTVRFSPTATGVANGSATVTSNGGSATVALSGTGTETPSPKLCVSPATLDFGAVTVGTSKDLSFTIQNCGTGTLSGSAAAAAPFSIVSGDSFSLAANQSQTVTVRFVPTVVAPISGSASVSSNGGSATVALSGTGTEVPTAKLRVSPTSLNFGLVPVGLSKDLSFTVQNDGTATLTGSVSTAQPFSIVTGANFSLAPNQSQAVTVRLTPTTSGAATSNVTVNSNGGSDNVSLTGTGKGPELAVSPTSLDFGTVQVGASKDLTFTVTNSGGGTLTGRVISVSPFRITAGNNFSLATGQSQVTTIRFAPDGGSSFSESASIETNADTATVSLHGVGEQRPELSVSPRRIDITCGKPATFTVTNVGGGTLEGNVTTTSGFRIVSGGTFSLRNGQSQTVTVSDSPPLSNLGNASVESNGGSDTVQLVAGCLL